jgi:hypothetical protein
VNHTSTAQKVFSQTIITINSQTEWTHLGPAKEEPIESRTRSVLIESTQGSTDDCTRARVCERVIASIVYEFIVHCNIENNECQETGTYDAWIKTSSKRQTLVDWGATKKDKTAKC